MRNRNGRKITIRTILRETSRGVLSATKSTKDTEEIAKEGDPTSSDTIFLCPFVLFVAKVFGSTQRLEDSDACAELVVFEYFFE